MWRERRQEKVDLDEGTVTGGETRDLCFVCKQPWMMGRWWGGGRIGAGGAH